MAGALKHDLEEKLGREMRFANDANCFALSEAVDGAGKGAPWCSARSSAPARAAASWSQGSVLRGPPRHRRRMGPYAAAVDDARGASRAACYCGRTGCIEQWVSGPALKRDIAARGEEIANELHEDRLARAFSMVINFLDPDVIVLGGGLSNVQRLYTTVPRLLPKYVYSQTVEHADRAGGARRRERRARRGDAMAGASAFLMSDRSFTNCLNASSRSLVSLHAQQRRRMQRREHIGRERALDELAALHARP